MADKAKFSVLGKFVEPSTVCQLLHDAESEYGSIRGNIDVDDTRDVVNARLQAKENFLTGPNCPFMNYMDCVNHMHKKTGLPLLLCVYYVFYLSESAGAIEWPSEFDAALAEDSKRRNLEIDFVSAISQAVMGAFVHPSKEWRAFNRELIEAVIDHEDQRRLKEAREMYDAINARNDE